MNEWTILFVDDDPYEMAPLVDAIDAQDDMTVVYRSDPKRAEEEVTTIRPDLIVTDMIMRQPRSATCKSDRAAGLNFCKAVRLEDKTTPIIVLTVVTAPEDTEPIRKYTQDVLHKPIMPRDLIARIRKALAS